MPASNAAAEPPHPKQPCHDGCQTVFSLSGLQPLSPDAENDAGDLDPMCGGSRSGTWQRRKSQRPSPRRIQP